MSPSAAPPSPQEIQRKLSVHSVSKVKSGNLSVGHVSGTESDSDSILTPDVLSPMVHSVFHAGTSSSQPPLSSIAERRSGSGEDSDEEDAVEGGWKTADIRTKPRNSVDESVIKSGYLWKKGERRKTWKKRWFVLRPAHLAYYKSSAEYQLLRLLELSDVHSCTQVKLKRHDNTFGLISPTRTFYLQADSPEDVRLWVAAIEEARQTLLATSTQTSSATPIATPAPAGAKERRPILHATAMLSASPPQGLHPITSSDSEDGALQPPPLQRGVSAPSPTATNFLLPPRAPPGIPKEAAKVILSGYLMKCGSKRRSWRKRWFVLTGEKLVYSGSHMDTKPHRVFLFNEILDALEYDLPTTRQGSSMVSATSPAHHSFSPDTDDGHAKHTFKIVTTKRTLLLCAPGEEDEIKWLGAIRALIARRSGSGVVPGETSKSAAAHSSEVNAPSTNSGSAGNVGIKSKVRRLSAGGSNLPAGMTILEADAREAKP